MNARLPGDEFAFAGDLASYDRSKSMPNAPKLYEKIIEQITDRPVSESLTDLILFAQLVGDKELERWAKLESDGYLAENPAMREDDVVPEYRTIAGQYRDYWDRPLVIQDPKLLFIQQDRLRNPAIELEGFAKSTGLLRYSHPTRLQLLRELGIEVHEFVFSPSAVRGILNAIRNRILEHLKNKHADMSIKPEAIPLMPETRRTIFVSKSFAQEDEETNSYFEGILRALSIPFETAERYAGGPISEKVEEKLGKCDFLIGIYVKRYEDREKRKGLTTQWLIRETGFIKGQGKDFIALVEEGVSDIAGFDAEKELIFFNREDIEKMFRATLRFLEALAYHGLVRGIS
jgi:hypothetical protein